MFNPLFNYKIKCSLLLVQERKFLFVISVLNLIYYTLDLSFLGKCFCLQRNISTAVEASYNCLKSYSWTRFSIIKFLFSFNFLSPIKRFVLATVRIMFSQACRLKNDQEVVEWYRGIISSSTYSKTYFSVELYILLFKVYIVDLFKYFNADNDGFNSNVKFESKFLINISIFNFIVE